MSEETESDIRQAIQDLREENNTAHRDIFTEVQKQNGRVRKLEMWRSWIAGGLAILTLGLILFVTFTDFTL